VTEAYEILSNKEKRALYDKVGMAMFDDSVKTKHYSGNSENYNRYYHNSRTENGSSDTFDDLFDDIFGTMFGGRKSHFSKHAEGYRSRYTAKEEPEILNTELTISFDEAAFGCDRFFELSGQNNAKIQVHIPAGIDEGQCVRVKRNDTEIRIKIHIQEKQGYLRKGMDIYTTQNIPFTTAVLGGETCFKTLYGDVLCSIPAGTQSGSKIRLKGKGIVSMKDASAKGDAYVTVGIEVPRTLSSEEKRILEQYDRVQKKQAFHRAV
jgi:molecular chaperone DnaJ